MVWKYQAGDNYDLDQLLGFKYFFMNDFNTAYNEVLKHEELKKWGLPNWRLGMVRRQVGLEEAISNLDTVERAIKEQWHKLV